MNGRIWAFFYVDFIQNELGDSIGTFCTQENLSVFFQKFDSSKIYCRPIAAIFEEQLRNTGVSASYFVQNFTGLYLDEPIWDYLPNHLFSFAQNKIKYITLS